MTQSHVKLPFWPHNPHKTNARNVGKFFKIAHKLAQLGLAAPTMEAAIERYLVPAMCVMYHSCVYVEVSHTKAYFGHINCPRQVHLLLEAVSPLDISFSFAFASSLAIYHRAGRQYAMLNAIQLEERPTFFVSKMRKNLQFHTHARG